MEEHGNISEQGNSHHVSPPPGDLGVQLAQDKTPIKEQGNIPEQDNAHHTSPPPGDLGVLAQEKIPITEPVIKQEQVTSQHLPPEFIPPGREGAGGQNTTLSAAGGEPALNLIQGGEVRAGGGTLAQENTPAEPGIILEQPNSQHLPLQGAGGQTRQHSSPFGGDSGAFASEKDLMSASFYEQEIQAEAAAPPPHILTDEEVRQLHAEADRKLEEKKKQSQQPYNTFGKMYFPPERR